MFLPTSAFDPNADTPKSCEVTLTAQGDYSPKVLGDYMTRVLIVDDHPVVLQGCRRILEDAGITTVLEASDTATGYELFRKHQPDLGVVDLSIRNDGLGGISLIRRINADQRRFPILVLSMHRDPTIVFRR